MSDIKHDPDLEEMWEEAERECRKLIGLKDGVQLPKLTVEDVLNKLDESKTKDEADAHTKRGKAKDCLRKTLVCVDSLGRIAAQGASVVFGPSEMCFNAISFLIRTTQNYSKIFAGITLLFERISAFLERFQIYTATVSIDKRLKRLVHQLLQSFMRICNMSLKLTRSHKVLMYTKVFLFNTDEGVQKELEGLECLVKDEVNMSVALILQSAKMTEATVTVGFAEMQARFQDVDEKIGGKLDGVASQVEDLHAMVERGEKESKMKQNAETNRKAIQKAFSIPDKESWTTDHRNYVGALIDESGNWLVQGNADFMSWARAESNAKPAFAVEGKDGFGKSHLFSAVVRHLFSLHTLQVSNRRVAIAYFFMQNDGQEKQDAKESNVIPEKRGDSLDVALKSIIWQLTTKDAGYQKSVAAPCINFEEFGDIEDVWNRLVISLSSIDATFFILLDGIENIQSERGQRLLRIIRRTMDMKGESQRLRVQWFVTGSPSAFSSGGTVGLEESPLVTKLTLGTCNRDDLLSFTDMKMNTMKALAAKSDPEVLQLRSTIRERLVEGVAGNFTKLEYKLRDISTKTRKDEIEEVLTHVTEDIGDMIVRQLDRLNKDLEGKDVEDLNELLIWVVAIEPHMAWYLTVPLLDEVLYLKASSRSLVPLLERVKTSFAPLLEAWENPYEDDHCVGIAPSFLEHFKASQKLGKVTTSGYSSILHPSEIAIVERFLKNICDEELFRRFEFEEYFRQKSGKKKATIYVDIESVHVQMVTTLLSTLCSIPKANCKQLIEYAVRALPYHLSEEKWAKADQQSKRIVGSLLVRLLTDEEIINTVWAAHLQVLRYYWMAKDDAVKTVLAWFKDPATTLDIPEQKRAWIDNLTSNARLQDDLLKDAALVLAKRWLCRQTWSMVEEFEVLSTYYAKIENRDAHDVKIEIKRWFEAPTAHQIKNVEAWVQRELKIDHPDSLWQTQMSFLFRNYDFAKDALDRGRSALELDPESWRARFSIAFAYDIEGPDRDLELAVEQMTLVAVMFRKDSGLATANSEDFYNILGKLGTWKTELKQYESAMEVFHEISEKYPDKNQTIFDILTLLKAQEKVSKIMEYLDDLNTQINEDGLSKLVALYHSFSSSEHLTFHNFVLSSLKGTSCMTLVRETFQVAIEAANSDENKKVTAMTLRYWYAHTLYHIAESDHDYDEALQIWEQNLAFHVSHSTIRFQRIITIRRIAPAYLQRAKKLGPDTPAGQDLMNRLKGLPKTLDQHEMDRADISRLIGRCCSLLGDSEEAKKNIRGNVRTAMELLSDDNPSNDWQGYIALALALMQLDDDKNALAAWSLICPTLEEDADATAKLSDKQDFSLEEDHECTAGAGRDDDANTPELTAEPASNLTEAVTKAEGTASKFSSSNHEHGRMANSCDGRCSRTWSFPDDMYYCKDCIDCQFDTKCYLKLKDGSLENKANCETSHDFLYIPKWDAEAQKKLPPNSVMVGENVLLVKDWLNGIWKEWGLKT